MKQRRTFITVALLVALLMLGIGYAAISNITLNINGTASATPNDENFKVLFDSSIDPTVTPSGNIANDATNTATITDDLNATLTVSGLTTMGDKVVAVYTIKNDSPELSADLAIETISNSNEEYFEITSVLADTTIAKGASTTVTVTVELIKTPIEEQEATLTIPLTASPVQP